MSTLLQARSGISPYNPLVVSLVLLAAGAAIAAVFTVREARGTHAADDRRSFAWLFGLVGGIGLLISGELFLVNWAGFPAQQYTELFGVAQTLYSTVLLGAASVLYADLDVRPFTWLAAISGVVLLQGARAILAFGLTREPLAAGAIWTLAGLGGVLLLPAAYADPEGSTRRTLLYAVSGLLVVLAAISLFMGVEAHYGHIAEVVGAA